MSYISSEIKKLLDLVLLYSYKCFEILNREPLLIVRKLDIYE